MNTTEKISYYDWKNNNIIAIKEILDGIYGEEFYSFEEIPNITNDIVDSVIDSCDVSDYSSIDNDKVLNIIKYIRYEIHIHFPEIGITNSKGIKHTLRDFYIKISLTPLFTNATYREIETYFQGKRGTVTEEEILKNYVHSHIAGNNYSSNRYRGFCLGGTGFNTLCSKLNHFFSIDDFTLFVIQLRDFLSWESLEGGPYHKISDLHVNSNSLIRENANLVGETRNLYSILVDNIESGRAVLEYTFVFTDYSVVIKLKNTNKLLNSLRDRIPASVQGIYDPTTNIISDRTIAPSGGLVGRYTNDHFQGDYIMFKNEKRITKIYSAIPEVVDVQVDTNNIVPIEPIYSSLINTLETKINKQLEIFCQLRLQENDRNNN